MDGLEHDRFAIRPGDSAWVAAWPGPLRSDAAGPGEPDHSDRCAAGESRDAAWPTRLARLPIVGENRHRFQARAMGAAKVRTQAYATAMVTPDCGKRSAELQRFPGNREVYPGRAPAPRSLLDTTPLRRLRVATIHPVGRAGSMGARSRCLPIPERHQGREGRDLR